MDYKAAGVDRELGDRFVDDIKPRLKATFRPEIESDIGDFGGFFRAPSHLKNPLWVATTDGVGTKLLLAEEAGQHRGVGQDVVAMCVNDLLCCRAEPIVFLDYLATGKIDQKILDEVVIGMADACLESGCSLIGGETAEMPGYYSPKRYDVAGFSLGVLEREKRFDRKNVKPGDVVFGFASSGFHSNGYSLVRKIMGDQNWTLNSHIEGVVLGDFLLKPTELYVKRALKLFASDDVKACAHITGGGLIENLPRGIDETSVRIVLKKDRIQTPPAMQAFVRAAKLEAKEAYSTWNMGIGFCVIGSKELRPSIQALGGIELGYVDAGIAKSDSVVIE